MRANVTVRGFINGVQIFPQHQLVMDSGQNAIKVEVPGGLFVTMWPGVAYNVVVHTYAA